MTFFDQIFTLLTTSPGNLIYHLALMFSITGTLYMAIAQWRSTGYPQVRRMLNGLLLLLAGQIVLFIASALVWQRLVDAEVLLPPLDRAIMFFSLVWVVWVWAYPEPSKSGDMAAMIASLLTLTGLILGVVSRSSDANLVAYNNSVQYIIWEVLGIAILTAGGVFLFTRKPQGWANGMSMVIILFVGHVLELIIPSGDSDYSGMVRLISMAAYPILLTLPARFPTPSDSPKTRTVEVYKENVSEHMKSPDYSSPVRERRRYSTDPKTLQTLLTLAAEVDAEKINQHISRAVAQAMLSDLCFLIFIGEDRNSLLMASGYDLIREESLEGGQLTKDSMPMLSGAILRGRPLRLPASTTSSDLQGLGDMLGLSNPGNLLNVPITSDKGTIGSVLLLSPYSNRLWNADDQTFLSSIAINFTPIIERGRKIAEFEHARNQATLAAEDARSSLARVQSINAETIRQMNEMKLEAEKVADVAKHQREMIEQIETLTQENEKLGEKLAGLKDAKSSDANYQYLENELRLTLQEVAYLQNSLAEANIRILELKKRPTTGNLSSEKTDVVASLAQELRQPMSSIVGYTDLLLGESVGILGSLQRKFVERIKTSTERIGHLIDDLIQITTMEVGLKSLKSEDVDLNMIIDNAMAYTSSQLREKNIALRIDLPETIQPIQADRESIQQILIHLLQNAGAVSPADGTVSMRVRTRREEGQDYVVLQVTDSGGGIKSEDLPEVFARRYRAENSLLQGVGDTGVGLSIARSLCEAQGGRIHVDTEMGFGSTFSVILPFKQPVAES